MYVLFYMQDIPQCYDYSNVRVRHKFPHLTRSSEPEPSNSHTHFHRCSQRKHS